MAKLEQIAVAGDEELDTLFFKRPALRRAFYLTASINSISAKNWTP